MTKKEVFSVLSGSDSLILKALDEGATGAIAATSNLLTNIDVAIYKHWQKGERQKAEEAQQSLEELRRVLKLGSIPAVLKKAMEIAEISVGAARYPVLEPKGEVVEEISSVVTAYLQKYHKLSY